MADLLYLSLVLPPPQPAVVLFFSFSETTYSLSHDLLKLSLTHRSLSLYPRSVSLSLSSLYLSAQWCRLWWRCAFWWWVWGLWVFLIWVCGVCCILMLISGFVDKDDDCMDRVEFEVKTQFSLSKPMDENPNFLSLNRWPKPVVAFSQNP